MTDVGSIVFPGGPNIVPGPLHTRHGLRRATLCKQERALTLRKQPRTSEERLPLEGKLAQRQLRLMRSKLPIITISWYNTATFDLIRHGP